MTQQQPPFELGPIRPFAEARIDQEMDHFVLGRHLNYYGNMADMAASHRH
jgi:hypothetical protein